MVFYFLGSIFYLFLVALITVICFTIVLVLKCLTGLFDRKGVILHRFSCFWASLYVWLNPFVTEEIIGRERLEKGKTYVICPNHRSIMDILALYGLFFHFKWVAKREAFRLPFFGWNMFLNGYIALDRDKPSSQMKMLKDSEENLLKGNSLIIFPEGTRSKDGKTMGKFRDGAFMLARKTECDVVPVALSGTEGVTKGFPFKKKHHMTIEILEPVPWDFGERFKDLNKETKGRIEEALARRES
ncbi:MAG: 1-acyl-sn-glycerol-3-phosphate acyltransferase [Spirochaetales bacterium]|nr:1-acyl-sn-glycerol-3-phosphate acyltransferase [Spirochaetales bacterium]